MTALYAGGSSIAIVGASDFKPVTDSYRVLYLVNSLVGMSATSLVLTYVMQVYSALQQRNALGLKLHLLTGESADAAKFLARLGRRDSSVQGTPIWPTWRIPCPR